MEKIGLAPWSHLRTRPGGVEVIMAQTLGGAYEEFRSEFTETFRRANLSNTSIGWNGVIALAFVAGARFGASSPAICTVTAASSKGNHNGAQSDQTGS